MKIAILSDTHNLLRRQVLEKLEGCEAILHAGDFCGPDILRALQAIAPTYAVRGNNDREWAEGLNTRLEFELAGLRVCMAHQKKHLPRDTGKYDLVICGHTHQYASTRQGKTLFLNPGSCGPRRFHLPATMALLTVEADGFTVECVEIPHKEREAVPRIDPGNIKEQIEIVMRESKKGRGPGEIAQRYQMDPALCDQIARLYVTHPGVTPEGIMAKMGL